MERPSTEEMPEEQEDDQECCNVPLCGSYVLGLLACLQIVGGVCLAFHRWDYLWLLLSAVGVVLIFVASLLHFCSNSSSRKKRLRRRSERHLQEHLLPSPLPLNNAYSVSQLSLNMLPTYFQGVQGASDKESFSQILHIKGQSFLLLPINSNPSSPQNHRWSTHVVPSTPDTPFPLVKDQGDPSRPMLMLTQKDVTPGLKEEAPKPSNPARPLVDQSAQTVLSDHPSANVSLSLNVAELPQLANETGNTHSIAVQISSEIEEADNCACTRCKSVTEEQHLRTPSPQVQASEELEESIYDSLPRRSTDNPPVVDPPPPSQDILINIPESQQQAVEDNSTNLSPSSEENLRTDCDDLIPDACSPPPSYEEVTTGTIVVPPPSFTIGYGTI